MLRSRHVTSAPRRPSLSQAIEVPKLLRADDDKIQVAFGTVDPNRDTPEVLREYIKAFDPNFLALCGDARSLADMPKEFKVFYQKVPPASSYTLDHTAVSYVSDPQGRLRLVLRHEHSAEDVASDLRVLQLG